MSVHLDGVQIVPTFLTNFVVKFKSLRPADGSGKTNLRLNILTNFNLCIVHLLYYCCVTSLIFGRDNNHLLNIYCLTQIRAHEYAICNTCRNRHKRDIQYISRSSVKGRLTRFSTLGFCYGSVSYSEERISQRAPRVSSVLIVLQCLQGEFTSAQWRCVT